MIVFYSSGRGGATPPPRLDNHTVRGEHKAQKKRAQKISNGVHGGGGKVTLTHLQKILLGKGAYATFRPIGAKREGN